LPGRRLHGGSSKRHNFQLGNPAEFGYELIPLHSPLLWKSLLLSFSPLSDMLKFSGQSRPSEVDLKRLNKAAQGLKQTKCMEPPTLAIAFNS
jgi:hypothetical protein